MNKLGCQCWAVIFKQDVYVNIQINLLEFKKKVWDYFNYINNNLQLNESHTLIRIDDLGMVKRVLSLIQYGIISYLLELVLNKSGSCEWML